MLEGAFSEFRHAQRAERGVALAGKHLSCDTLSVGIPCQQAESSLCANPLAGQTQAANMEYLLSAECAAAQRLPVVRTGNFGIVEATYGRLLKLADRTDLGSVGVTPVRVRVPHRPPSHHPIIPSSHLSTPADRITMHPVRILFSASAPLPVRRNV